MTLEEIIDQHYEELNENDLYIWQYIYHHKTECQRMSIQELAHACNVSHTSIIRFAKKLGLDGYSELKVYIKWSLNRPSNFDHQILKNSADEMRETIDQMEYGDHEQILQSIDLARRVFIYPTGEVQYHVGQEMKREFAYRGKIMHLIEGSTELDTVLNRIDPSDVFLIISLSGDNEIAVTLAKFLQRMHVPTIGMAMDNGNLLSKYCSQFIGIKTSYFDTGFYEKRFTCTAQYFLAVELLFLSYLEYSSMQAKEQRIS